MQIKKGGNVSRMLEGIPIPDMFRAEQAFDKSRIVPAEIPSIVRKNSPGRKFPIRSSPA